MLSREQARDFYDRFGAKQDSQKFYEDPAVRVLLAQADLKDAKAVFEFGCGTGRLAEELLSQHLSEDASYVGCDLSTTMVGLARERLARFGARVQVRQTDGAPRIDAPDAAYDRFLSTYVLDLLPEEDMSTVLGEARRVLAPGGRLCLVGLTEGTTLPSRAIIAIWKTLHRVRPAIVGGCRPVELRAFLSDHHWQIDHHSVVVAFGIPSEVLVARKRSAGAASV
jgi:ubiquinone/menaquinone biosynthesis C-methylase UbiE